MRYVISKSFQSKVERTPRVLEVAESFGLGLQDKVFTVYDNLELDIEQGDVVYITGQSGSGKSLLLRELAERMSLCSKGEPSSVADVDRVIVCDKPLIDQVGETMTDAIRILSMAGINDAYLLIRKPGELSDGQRYRLGLAKLIESGAKVWVADEFGAKLDRVTAKVVALNMQKIARKMGVTLIVATTHTDLEKELGPDLKIEKRYMDRVEITTDREVI